MAMGKKDRIGLAVGPETLTGVLLRAGAERTVTVPLSLSPDSLESCDQLVTTLEELASRLGISLTGMCAHIALLPPLADTRMLALPPLRPAEAEAVLRRDAARYFLGGTGPRVIGVGRAIKKGRSGRSIEPDAGRSASPNVLAASVAASLVEGIHTAASRLGLTVGSIVPACAAWAEAAPSSRHRPAFVVAVHGGVVNVMRSERGSPRSIRRIPVGSASEILDALGEGSGGAVVFADPDSRQSISRTLSEAGWSIVSPDRASETGVGTSAAEAAARYAEVATLELVPPSMEAERAAQSRRTAFRLVGLAAVILVFAAGVHLWGAQRTLDKVRADRASIADQVAPLIMAQDSLNRLNDRVRAVADLTSQSAHWTGAIVDLALLLPRDSYLTALNANGDLIEIEAAGDGAGEAIEALRGANRLTDVRLEGVVERELENGETVIERFRLSARLRRPEPVADSDPGDRSTMAELLRESRDGAGGSSGGIQP